MFLTKIKALYCTKWQPYVWMKNHNRVANGGHLTNLLKCIWVPKIESNSFATVFLSKELFYGKYVHFICRSSSYKSCNLCIQMVVWLIIFRLSRNNLHILCLQTLHNILILVSIVLYYAFCPSYSVIFICWWSGYWIKKI